MVQVKSKTVKELGGDRSLYNPFTDNWAGRPLSSRKKVLDYVLLGTIGRGAFGKVRLAISVKDKYFYAVKIISKSVSLKVGNRFCALVRIEGEETDGMEKKRGRGSLLKDVLTTTNLSFWMWVHGDNLWVAFRR